MKDSQCMARLLASAVHDMRNVLAVIRESGGLAQDLAALEKSGRPAQGPSPGKDRLAAALQEVQKATTQGAALSEGMDYLAQAGAGEGQEGSETCDLGRVCRTFCLLAARQARASQMRLICGESHEPVWAAVPALAMLRSLLEVFDLCASVGGQVELLFSAGRFQKQEGVIIEVREGPNREMALSALTGSPLLSGIRPGWRAVLMPWREVGARYFLSLSASDPDGE